mgnify:FL=1
MPRMTSLFQGKNHLHAVASALSTLGGFQMAPEWFHKLSQYAPWQILMTTVFIWQSGGQQDFVYSLLVAIVFYAIIYFSKYITITHNHRDGDYDGNDQEDHFEDMSPDDPSANNENDDDEAPADPTNPNEAFSNYY